jgi:hypothetical protein
VVLKNPIVTIEALHKSYPLKGVRAPEYYINGDINQPDDSSGATFLASSVRTHIKNITEKIEKLLNVTFKGYKTPMDRIQNSVC